MKIATVTAWSIFLSKFSDIRNEYRFFSWGVLSSFTCQSSIYIDKSRRYCLSLMPLKDLRWNYATFFHKSYIPKKCLPSIYWEEKCHQEWVVQKFNSDLFCSLYVSWHVWQITIKWRKTNICFILEKHFFENILCEVITVKN